VTGLLEADWDISPKGRKAKYYRLSDLGVRELRRQQATWKAYVEAVGKIEAIADEA
jgi:DNA-binding PadR family transcriptional regulator